MTEASMVRPPKGLRRPIATAGDLPVGREAITLPVLLLTVAALGGVRVTTAGALAFVAPSLMSLVLGVLLVATLVQSGALAPDRLMNGHRTPLENASGAVVGASLLVASAQVFTLVTPAAGFLAFVFTAFYLLLLWNTLAVEPDRRQLLRSLLVVLGGAFILKFVVLAAVYDPASGLLRRVVLAMVEGVSLGALGFVPDGPATGYLAFATLAGFFLSLTLLPGRRGGRAIS
jgi:hypothetical protein